MTLGVGNIYTAKDSIAWPLSYASRTRVRMTVTGKLGRRYVTTMHPSFANTMGQLYYFLDADGEYASGQCWGEVFTSFRLASGYWGDNISGCYNAPANPPSQDASTPA